MKRLLNKILFAAAITAVSTSATAQEIHGEDFDRYPALDRCATMPSLQHQINENPEIAARMEAGERAVADWLRTHPEAAKGGTVTIPVVVHIVYNENDSAAQNIPDSQVYSQMDVLNEDFRLQAPNIGNLPSVFDSVAADVNIEFCLASRDPNGGWTTGITRTSTTTSFALTPFTNNVKRSADGGVDPWPVGEYLNIWVCDMSFFGQPAVLGYAQFPLSAQESIDQGAVAENDGVVIQYQYFGRTNDPQTAPSNLGRTTTHEVGHYLGLRHVWGDGDCTADDYCEDTPLADDQSQFDCQATKNTCDDSAIPYWNGTDPPNNVQNFMDYSADDCMSMFSNHQSARIWAFMQTDSLRNALMNSQGCAQPTYVNENGLNEGVFDVYPNPAQHTLNVKLNEELVGAELRLVNALGQVVETRRFESGLSTQTFSLVGKSRGLWLVQLHTPQGVATKKLIVR